MKEIAVVILNYNNYKLTMSAIDNVKSLNNNISIIVVDNCSPNESFFELSSKYSNVENIYVLKTEKNCGYAAGNNYGVRFIYEELKDVNYCFIMNPDIIVPNYNVFSTLIKYLNEIKDCGCITTSTILNGCFKEPNESSWSFLNKRELMLDNSIFKRKKYKVRKHIIKDDITKVDIVQGCFFGFKIKDFISAGYFDENTFLYSEEAILAKRFKNIGKSNYLCPFLYINHNHLEKNKSLIKYKNKAFDIKCFYNSRKYYIKKYSGFNKFYSFISCTYLSIELRIKLMILRIKLR